MASSNKDIIADTAAIEAVHAPFDTVEEAIAAIAAGQPVVVTDDESRENEGDLVVAASKITPEVVNMMIRAGGLICVPMTDWHLRRLGLNPMVQQNRESHGTAFTVSVDAAEGITTGISVHDRTATIRILADPNSTPDQLVQPGHIFPLRARPGGVLERAGHTEAAVDLASMAGLHPAAVICEILNEDGTCARLPELVAFKKRYNLKLISIASLIAYRHRRECLVSLVQQDRIETDYGQFDLRIFKADLDNSYHYALSLGKLGPEPTLVRVHSENLLGDVFGKTDTGSRKALNGALEQIAKAGHGALVYLSHPCAGLNIPIISNDSKVKQPVSQSNMDLRTYGVGAQILSALGLRAIRLLSSSTRKVVGLEGYGLEIVEQIHSTLP